MHEYYWIGIDGAGGHRGLDGGEAMIRQTWWPLAAALTLGGCGDAGETVREEPDTAGAVEDGFDSDAGADWTQAEADAAWAALLSTYATADGGFRYAALFENDDDIRSLDAFLNWVARPSEVERSREESLAFWINAYNALTIQSVISLWPVENVLEEPGFFDERVHEVDGELLTLNELENERIRPLGEPRIHFAVNCASTSCPRLNLEPIRADRLEEQLETLTEAYVGETTVVDRAAGEVRVSRLFDWFGADFEAGGGVRAFVAQYVGEDEASLVLDPAFELVFHEYDWSINARP